MNRRTSYLTLLALGTVAWSCSHQTAPTPAPVAPPPAAGRGVPPTTPTTPVPTPTPTPPDSTPAPGGGRGGRGNAGGRGGAGGAAGEPNPQPYNQVVRGAGMINKTGMIKTHQTGNQLLFEIPRSLLNKDILVLTEIEKTTNNVGQGGQSAGSKVMHWVRRGDRILLQNIAFNIIADPSLPVAKAVENANVPQIVASFNVEAYNPQDSAAVIDVSSLFLQPPQELSPGAEFSGQPAAGRSFIEKAPTWVSNTNVHATLTYAGGGRGGAAAAGGGRGGRGGGPPASATIGMLWTFYKLPDVPMMPRLFDDRVGFFSSTQTDYGLDVPRAKQTRYIARYRLECSDQKIGNLCVPKKQIVYYIDPATPTKWVPWIKKAIEDWQVAFAEAGFYKGIVAKDAPTAAEDPDWSISDARYSVIDWLPSSTENASGPHVSDPRSGEILNAHVQLYHNVLNLGRDWYITQAGPNDPRAQKLPLPDSLMGRLLEYVVAHEVGHTIGLQHDMKGSGTYEVDSLRSPTWVAKMGHTPSIMDYSRFNYVAQPEDKVDVKYLIPDIGPYDKFAIRWGYTPIPAAKSMWDEVHTLSQWAMIQDKEPWLRFTTVDASGTDPEDNTEAVGDKDPAKAAELGQRNIKRVMAFITAATSTDPDATVDELQELYGRTVSQWRTEMSHVATQIGGATSQEKYVGQPGPRFIPVPRQKQKDAVKFINENVFKTPQFLVPETITRRLEPSGSIPRVTQAQTSLLNALLDQGRMNRLVEYDALSTTPGSTYPLTEYLGDVRSGIWGELSMPTPKVDAFRRALQRSYMDLVKARLNPPAADSAGGGRGGGGGGGRGGRGGAGGLGDARGVLRGELRALDAMLKLAIPKTSDRATKLHLEDMRTEIDGILKGKVGSTEGIDQ